MSESILFTNQKNAIHTITINRPNKLNTLNKEILDKLHKALSAAKNDSKVRAIIITGAGEKAFIAGADIAEMNTLTAIQAQDFSIHGQRVMRYIEKMPKPVLAMINGFALGGGLELAMSCHLRVAAETAKLGQPEINLGLIPGFGGTQRLLRLAGRAATIELCLTGTPISAQRAMHLGIVNRITSANTLEEETTSLATQLANAAPLALRSILNCINVGNESGIEEGLSYEASQFGLICASQDMREGTSAFLERRKPNFTGQ